MREDSGMLEMLINAGESSRLFKASNGGDNGHARS